MQNLECIETIPYSKNTAYLMLDLKNSRGHAFPETSSTMLSTCLQLMLMDSWMVFNDQFLDEKPDDHL